ncbi:helix-hairpin-helix domain-containing protein [Herpetosiphon giganteus]|uniref:helix-hairpin-helix domain-containing protein n=1 Tax=Herpetosiphon giganteus TaxID=2029754 RepID=UPI00195AE4C5|nr:helix-hairpin-helix domain-containing protein [Herpetosiphon giganteus]MBM7845353.1 ribosomal protein L12E/L44/L45/RPP1/RPP2 [Herpetosiphon giganteus]
MANVQVTLADSWIHMGVTYLSGVHTLDESIATVLVAANAATNPMPVAPAAAEPVQRVETPNADGAATPTNDGGEAPSGEPSATLEVIVGSKAAASLAAAGYTSYGDAITADDATLSAIDGIGEATIKKLREHKAA